MRAMKVHSSHPAWIENYKALKLGPSSNTKTDEWTVDKNGVNKWKICTKDVLVMPPKWSNFDVNFAFMIPNESTCLQTAIERIIPIKVSLLPLNPNDGIVTFWNLKLNYPTASQTKPAISILQMKPGVSD